MPIFLQLCNERLTWEEVDEFLFTKRDRAVNDDGTQRYSGNYIFKDDVGSRVNVTAASDSELRVVARLLGIKPDPNAFMPNGGARDPGSVRVKLPQKTILYNPKTGEQWRLDKKAT